MIRPLTCICVMLAAGSGLYLYQTKHRTLMLDRQIADVLQQADVARARTTVLKTEYTLLSQPERLAGLSARYLTLKVATPSQYVQLADLDSHLPPVQVFPPPGKQADTAPDVPLAAASTDGDEDAAADPAPASVVSHSVAVATLDPARRLYGDGAAAPGVAVSPSQPTRLAGAAVAHAGKPPAARRAAGGYAGVARAEPMPMAAPRPVASRLLATASLHPAGQARPRITTATYTPRGDDAGGSMLGGGDGAGLAPPVPVSN